MPLLSRLYGLNAASPLAALTQPQQTPFYGPEHAIAPQSPTMPQGAVAMSPGKQSGPFNANAPQFQAGTQTPFWQRLQSGAEGLQNNSLFNIGMSLLAGSENGGDWGVVQDRMRQFGQDQQQRQMIQNEQRRQKVGDAREGTIFERQQTEWGQQDQQRADWQRAVQGEQDPQRRAQLQAVGPQGYGQFLQQERAFSFQAEQAALDRRNAINVAGMRLTGANRPEGASPYWQRPSGRDQMMLQDYEGAVQNGRTALIGLDRLERLFGEMIQRDAQGRPLPASMRMSMSRLMQINPEARAAYEQIQSQVWPMVLQNLEGLAPVTEVELGQALARTVNADMTPEAALAEIQRMRTESRRAVDLGLRAFDFANEAGSLNTGRNASGQNWIEYSGGAFEGKNNQTRREEPRQAAPMPRIGDVIGGYRYRGGDPADRRNWVRVGQNRIQVIDTRPMGGSLR